MALVLSEWATITPVPRGSSASAKTGQATGLEHHLGVAAARGQQLPQAVDVVADARLTKQLTLIVNSREDGVALVDVQSVVLHVGSFPDQRSCSQSIMAVAAFMASLRGTQAEGAQRMAILPPRFRSEKRTLHP